MIKHPSSRITFTAQYAIVFTIPYQFRVMKNEMTFQMLGLLEAHKFTSTKKSHIIKCNFLCDAIFNVPLNMDYIKNFGCGKNCTFYENDQIIVLQFLLEFIQLVFKLN